VLVDEITGTGAGSFLRQPYRDALPSRSGQRAPGLEYEEDHVPESLEEQELPF
jgi:hypothetical protein